MKMFLLLVFSVAALQSFAGDKKCNLTTKKDDYGGPTITTTEHVKLASDFPMSGSHQPWVLRTFFRKANDTVTMFFVHGSQSGAASYIGRLAIKFKDGTILKRDRESINAGGENDNGKGYVFNFCYILLTGEELQKLASQEVEKFKVEFDNFYEYPIVDRELKGKFAEDIKQNALCIQSEQ